MKTSAKESLSHEIFQIQRKYGFPSLVSETRELLLCYELPNIIDDNSLTYTKKQWKILVKEAIMKKSEEDVKRQFTKFSKLNKAEFKKETLEIKEYVSNMKLSDARTHFRVRSSTLPFKMNMKSDKKFSAVMWRCDSC